MVLLAIGVAFGLGDFGGGEPTSVRPSGPASTVRIVRQTLVDATTVTAEIGFGDAMPLASKAAGTVTWLPPVGMIIARGDTLFRVDEVPTVLLYGALPAFRSLQSGLDGSDVEQFEKNLRALGYEGFTVDRRFRSDTTQAVRRWQRRLGIEPTGVVGLANVVYGSGPLRVSQHLVRLGAAATADLFEVTGTTKVVTASVPAAASSWATVGRSVTVTLPGGATTPGRVTAVAREASDDTSGNAPSVTVTVSVADQGALKGTDAGLRYVTDERQDVLTVPIAALLALPQGGYGLELADGRLVPVQVGLFADGQVEVRGDDLAEGAAVGMPQ